MKQSQILLGHGHEIVLLVAQLEKEQAKYTPSEPISRYHSWIQGQYTIPTTKDGVTDRLTVLIGDWKFMDLAKKHADNFNKLAEMGSVSIELFISDEGYWGEVMHNAHCERDPKCDVDVLKHQPGATPEEIERIKQIEDEINDVSFDLWDTVLPQAYAWTKVQVSYDLFGSINLGACLYLNCHESWDLTTIGADSIDEYGYGNPDLEHVRRDYSMLFFGRSCDNYAGPQPVINQVETTPYLALELETELSDDGLNINSCAYATHYDSSASHDFITGILVESSGSYYWINS